VQKDEKIFLSIIYILASRHLCNCGIAYWQTGKSLVWSNWTIT